ncbi:MAG: shikimate kinase [Flavobacteriales bacterium]|nr:shikimate kinase [Flavobacteriales bacterium]
MRIYLIGFMGAGKSTLGPLLAKKLGYSCIETDILVEKLAGLTIPEIFRIHGEHHFRELEKHVLHFTQLCEDTVICTGGGTPCYANNLEWMKMHGLTIYLSCDDEVLIQRIENSQKERPLFTNQKSIVELLDARRKFYQQAHMHVLNNNTPETTIKNLVKAIPKNYNK